MKLGDLIKGIDIVEWKGFNNHLISDICYHSGKAKPGSVFVAIEGFRSDGHIFIQDAISRGAVAIVVSKCVNHIAGLEHFPYKTAVIRVKDSRSALSKMAANFFNHPSRELNMIGVTGTNGKTTITCLIYSILKQREVNVGQIGSLGICNCNKWQKSSHTTPESLELQTILRNMSDSGIKSCVMEVSSHALQLKRVQDVDFNGAVFSNLTHEHLDFHENMENYFQTKRKLFYMTSQFNIVNADDSYGRRLAGELANRAVPVVTYGLAENADFKAHYINLQRNCTNFNLITPAGNIKITTFLPGKYNIYNCLAAAACGYMMGFNLYEIKAGIEQVKQIPGRFEVIHADRNVKIIIDYAHTPDGFRQLLETVSRFADGRIIMVFGCVGERDKSKRKVMGEIASQYSDLCILTTDNCRSEDPSVIIKQIKEGFYPGTDYMEILDREEAIRYAIMNSQKNDTILITGKGHERRQIIGNEEFYFNERTIVTTAIKDLEKLKR